MMAGRPTVARKRSVLLASTYLTATWAFFPFSAPFSRRMGTFTGSIHCPTIVPPMILKVGSRHVKCAAQRRHGSSSSESVTVEKVARSLKEGGYGNILVVAGAGVSCSAGIPDFRTPGSGLYDNLDKYNLPYPEAIFDVDFYRQNPMPFVTLAKEMWPGVKYRPTLTHCFFRLLDEKGILRRIYTQNIDGLEAVAGVDPDTLVECHGNFRAAGCTDCGARQDVDECKSSMVDEGVAPTCNSCGGLVKPSIVFFGEVMPDRFSELVDADVAACDLVVVVGTSLLVAPVANVPDWVGCTTHRLLINREMVGSFHGPTDTFLEGNCDESVRKLCQLAGWEEELDRLYSGTNSM